MPFPKNMIMVLDTETCSLDRHVYDVGVVITDRSGKVYEKFNALVEENFENAERMMGAFYAKKIFTHYARMLQDGDITLESWGTIVAAIRALVSDYGVTVISAYNLPFDLRVMKATNQDLGSGSVLPHSDFKLLDIWRFACETKLNTRLYKELAADQGWISPAGNIKTGAEFAYRFIAGQWTFAEDHTALSDAEIEVDILSACFATRKRIPYNDLSGHPWRIVNS